MRKNLIAMPETHANANVCVGLIDAKRLRERVPR